MAENFEVARFENSLIFQINDEPISRIDTLNNTNCSSIPTLSIILNSQKRQKRNSEQDNKQSYDIQKISFNNIFIVNNF